MVQHGPRTNALSPLGLQGPSVASAERSPRDARSVLSTRGDPTLCEANVSLFDVLGHHSFRQSFEVMVEACGMRFAGANLQWPFWR